MTSRLITDLGCYRQVSRWFPQLKSSSRQNFINLLGFLGYSNLICRNTWSQQSCENVRNTLPRTNAYKSRSESKSTWISQCLQYKPSTPANSKHCSLTCSTLSTSLSLWLSHSDHTPRISFHLLCDHKNNDCHLLLQWNASIPTFKSLKEFMSPFYRWRTRGSTKLSNVFIIYKQS